MSHENFVSFCFLLCLFRFFEYCLFKPDGECQTVQEKCKTFGIFVRNILNCHYFICNFTKLPSIALKERIAQFSCGIVAKPFIMQTYCRFIERMRSLRWILLLFDHSIWNNAEKIREREREQEKNLHQAHFYLFKCGQFQNIIAYKAFTWSFFKTFFRLFAHNPNRNLFPSKWLQWRAFGLCACVFR